VGGMMGWPERKPSASAVFLYELRGVKIARDGASMISRGSCPDRRPQGQARLKRTVMTRERSSICLHGAEASQPHTWQPLCRPSMMKVAHGEPSAVSLTAS